MQPSLTAIIVDDDESGRSNLEGLLVQYCTGIDIRGLAASVREAQALLETQQVDVIFLDIRMPVEDGFALLNHIHNGMPAPHIVFTTAYDQYAIKAIRSRAFDYLLKPIDVDELRDCVQRLIAYGRAVPDALPEEERISSGKISISHARGTRIIDLKDILYLEGDKNYTVLHLIENDRPERFVVSRTLGDYELTLPGSLFFRIHKSYIINLAHLREYRNNDGGHVIMSNERRIEISRRRSGQFRQFINDHYHVPGKK